MENQKKQPGLYNPQFEHDNCGIGAVVSIKRNEKNSSDGI